MFKFFLFLLICRLSARNVRRTRAYTKKQRLRIAKKHEELKRRYAGDMYTIENAYGCFSVCVQNHFNYDEIGYASYYDWGHLTATGEKFSCNNYTAAHPYLPIPCVAEITTLQYPRKRLIVKINDRGPFVQNPKVIIDLTTRCAKELGFYRHGLLNVRIRVLKKATMMLKEYGGDVEWVGDISFKKAVIASRFRSKKMESHCKTAGEKASAKRNKVVKKRRRYRIHYK